MKTTRNNVLSAAIAAGAPLIALLAIGNVLPADVAIALISVTGIVAFAIFDYSRRTASLRVKNARVLRPALPVAKPATAPVAEVIAFRRAA